MNKRWPTFRLCVFSAGTTTTLLVVSWREKEIYLEIDTFGPHRPWPAQYIRT